MKRDYDRFLYVDISTFDSLRERGVKVIELIDEILLDFILPFNRQIQIQLETDEQLKLLKEFLLPVLPVEDLAVVEANDPFGLSRKGAKLIF